MLSIPLHCLLLPIIITSAQLSQSFQNFIRTAHSGGPLVVSRLVRSDLSTNGSYGGGNHTAGTKTSHHPVLIVHPLTCMASYFSDIQQFFKSHGYLDEEVYGTTYWNGTTPASTDKLKCAYMQVMRKMLKMVGSYTNKTVDVLAFGTGVLVMRKAILGGKCKDVPTTNLGKRLTRYVKRFVSVGGPNSGIDNCSTAPGMFEKPCSKVNGMVCNSQFIKNINNNQRYESMGWTITIFSTDDEVNGYRTTCRNRVTGRISTEKIKYQVGPFFREKFFIQKL